MSIWNVNIDNIMGSEGKKIGKTIDHDRRGHPVRFAAVSATLIFGLLLVSIISASNGQAAFISSAQDGGIESDTVTTLANAEKKSDDPKVTICHRPPGNPTNAKIIRVAQSVVVEHLAHGDPIGDASLDVLYVDAAAEFPGNGRSESPFRRITDALKLARCIRQAEGNFISAEEPLEIRVAPGEYIGTYSEADLAADETLEALPIILNVPNLILQGSTTPELDDDGRPTGEVTGPETVISSVEPLAPFDFEILLFITDTTDGMAGNQTTIEGFTLLSGHSGEESDFGGTGIDGRRVEDYVIRQNIIRQGFYLAMGTIDSNGEMSTNYMTNTETCAICSYAADGTVDILSNRILNSLGGILLAPTTQHFPFTLGAQAEEFSVDPFETPAVAHFDGTIINNDVSGHNIAPNFSFGIRLMMYGFGSPPHVIEQSLSSVVRDNTIHNNAFGVHVDAGFAERNELTPLGDFRGTFGGNDVLGNCRTSMLVTFTRNSATLFPDQLSRRPYLQDSTYAITFEDDVFADRWIDHPVEDPIDGRVLNNVYLENGETVAPGTRIVPFDPENPEPCIFD